MKSKKVKIVCGVLAAALIAGSLAGCGGTKNGIDGTKTAFTVNGEKMNLGQANFLLRYQQASTYAYYSTMYSLYGMEMQTNFFDQIQTQDDGTSLTTGESLKQESTSAIERMLVIRQHAEEYNVALTEEQEQGAADAADAFIADNDAEVVENLGVTRDDVLEIMRLYAIQSLMYDPMTADADTEVSDEEAQQSSISMAVVSIVSDETDEDGNNLPVSDEEKVSQHNVAQLFLDAVKSADDPSEVSFTDIRDEVNNLMNGGSEEEEVDKTSEDYVTYVTASTATYGSDDTTLEDAVKEAAADLKDGEYYDGIIEGEDAYYIIRMDQVRDEEATQSHIEDIIEQRKADCYDELLDEWIEASDISVSKEWEALTVDDRHAYTIVSGSADEDTATDSTSTDDTAADSTSTDSTSTDSTATDSAPADDTAADSTSASSTSTDSSSD